MQARQKKELLFEDVDDLDHTSLSVNLKELVPFYTEVNKKRLQEEANEMRPIKSITIKKESKSAVEKTTIIENPSNLDTLSLDNSASKKTILIKNENNNNKNIVSDPINVETKTVSKKKKKRI